MKICEPVHLRPAATNPEKRRLMANRRSFRPSSCETLEERVVMSTTTAAIHVDHAIPLAASTAAKPVTVGALGDSLTDEYRFYPPDRSLARNWVEILNSVRHVDCGAFTTKSRSEPRNQGFAFNWALSDATSEDMVANQLPGLTAQVASGQVHFASILIGGDDFLDLLGSAATGGIQPDQFAADVAQTTSQLITNVETSVSTLLAANPNVDVAVWTLADVTQTPLVRDAAAANPDGPAALHAVSQGIAKFNSTVTALANSNPRVALVDLAAAAAAENSSPTGTYTVAGQTISLSTVGNNYHDFYLADGLHVGTVAQGTVADLFINAIDTKFGARVAPITPDQIIKFAQKVQLTTSHPKGMQLP